jgi:acetoin utilization deacetylase AcuC-like enzyme
MSAELLMVEQRRGNGGGDDGAVWILEAGQVRPGADDNRRMAEVRSGLVCHGAVRVAAAGASGEQVESALGAMHEAGYLAALAEAPAEPVVMPELTPPGLPPDIPVSAGLVAAAREGVRTAISAAALLLAGGRFSYALCRPPGHHAGPGWFAGYCYLNSAAAAALTLAEGGMRPVGILDVDLHYPNGTAAIVAGMEDVRLHSLHAWPATNVAARTVTPYNERERVVEFSGSPSPAIYLDAVGRSVEALSEQCEALVVSLGYDTVRGDPHGSWGFAPTIFAQIGRLLAGCGRPVCVVQEGGYALGSLAACSYAFAAGLLDEAVVPA